VAVFDVRTGERTAEAGEEYDAVLAADISPDQSLIALGGPKRMVRVYNAATGELQYEIKKHTDWVTAMAFSPDGVLLATADRASGLVVWEAHSGRIFYDLTGHRGPVTGVSWRPDSNVLASASEDGTIKLWNMDNGAEIRSWNAHEGGVDAVEFTPDGRLVSVGRDKVARLWKGDGSKLRDFTGLDDIGLRVAFDSESQRVLAGDWTGAVRVWSAEDGTEVGRLSTAPPNRPATQAVRAE
jgi:WD40 repeat protein